MANPNEPGGTPQGNPGSTTTDPLPNADPAQNANPPQDPNADPNPSGEPTPPQTPQEPPADPKEGGSPGKPQEPSEPPKQEPQEPEPKEGEPKKEFDIPKPEDYKIPEGLPKELGQFAHDIKLTQEQLDKTVQVFDQYSKVKDTATKAALRQMGEAHVKNWGPDAKFRLSLAKRALKQNDPEGQLAKALSDSGYGNHPAVLDFLYNLGRSMKEGGFLKTDLNVKPGGKTRAQRIFPNHPGNKT